MPQNQPIEDRHPLGPPALGRLGDQRVDRRSALRPCRCASDEANARSVVGGRIGVRPLQREERLGGAGRRRRGRSPTDTGSAAPPRGRDGADRPCARAPSALRPGACARRVELRDDRRHLDRGDRRLPPLVRRSRRRARSSASSTELVVSTPNVIGTPVAAAAAVEAVRDRRRDVLEVRRLAANQAAEADDGVEARRSRPRAARPAGSRTRPARGRP